MNRCTYCYTEIKRYGKKNQMTTKDGITVKCCSLEKCRQMLEIQIKKEKTFRYIQYLKYVFVFLALLSVVFERDKLYLTQLGLTFVALISILFPTAGYNFKGAKPLEQHMRSSMISGIILLIMIAVWAIAHYGFGW